MLRSFVIASVLLSVIISSCLNAKLISEAEYQLIDSVLERAGLDSESLNFEKDWSFSTDYKIDKIVEILNNPLQFPRFAEELKDRIESRDVSGLSTFLSELIFEEYLTGKNSVKGITGSEDYFAEAYIRLVKRPRDLFKYGDFLFETAYNYHQSAYSGITEEEKKLLTMLSLSMWSDNEERTSLHEHFKNEDLAERFDSLELSDFKAILDRIEWKHFIEMNKVFANGAVVLKERVSQLNFSNKRPLTKETKWGKFVIGSINDDVCYEPFSFMIEPSGNEIYYSSVRTDFDNPFYLIIDLEGDDVWRNERTAGLYSVLSGVGWSFDFEGNDIYEAQDQAFSSFLGFQYHYDKGGDDIYSVGRYSLGAATFGISININDKGNDIYNVTGYGQGFGGTLGAGLVIDYEGNDRYYAGGKYNHAPLRPEDYRSLSQGFGFGVRPHWGGGIGLLYDGDGNDTYTGGVYAQGVGYWYALGILLDGGGNDTFSAVQYAQGSGIHLAGGLLHNKSGDDSYYSRYGPGQGAGHDYAVGFLIDREGDDHYSIDGGNGLGLTNSVGIFIDVEGNDRYERNRNTNYGYANRARDSGGIGIFLDTGGEDIYADTLWTNNDFQVRETYGIALDTLMAATEEAEDDEPVIDSDIAFIDTLTVVADIFRIAAEWEVGSSVERVRKARERILDFEETAAEYIYHNKLATQSGLEYRAINDFAGKSDVFTRYIGMGLSHPDTLAVKNAISLVGDQELTEYLPQLTEFLAEKKFVLPTLSVLGRIKVDESVELLRPYVTSNSEHYRFVTARSLKNLDSAKSKALLRQMANDKSFLVRTAVGITFEHDENEN